MKDFTDSELLNLWHQYSEDCWAAGFITPDDYHVERFIKWLESDDEPECLAPTYDYEFEMLEKVREKLAANP